MGVWCHPSYARLRAPENKQPCFERKGPAGRAGQARGTRLVLLARCLHLRLLPPDTILLFAQPPHLLRIGAVTRTRPSGTLR